MKNGSVIIQSIFFFIAQLVTTNVLATTQPEQYNACFKALGKEINSQGEKLVNVGENNAMSGGSTLTGPNYYSLIGDPEHKKLYVLDFEKLRSCTIPQSHESKTYYKIPEIVASINFNADGSFNAGARSVPYFEQQFKGEPDGTFQPLTCTPQFDGDSRGVLERHLLRIISALPNRVAALASQPTPPGTTRAEVNPTEYVEILKLCRDNVTAVRAEADKAIAEITRTHPVGHVVLDGT